MRYPHLGGRSESRRACVALIPGCHEYRSAHKPRARRFTARKAEDLPGLVACSRTSDGTIRKAASSYLLGGGSSCRRLPAGRGKYRRNHFTGLGQPGHRGRREDPAGSALSWPWPSRVSHPRRVSLPVGPACPARAALAPSHRPLSPPGRHLFKGCEPIDMKRPPSAAPPGNGTVA